jgi:aminomuconate-semialdehyde/2-hydroxymuconate-6-semialdehyde dehydrogenase
MDSNTNMGALISDQHMHKVLKYVQLAKDSGATIAYGGHQLHLPGACAHGYFVSPTIITNISQQHCCVQEEIFGPVVCVIPFQTEEEVIGFANDSTYGLSATVWSENVSKLHRVARSLQVGTVWLNCWLQRDLRVPFGGMKMSGTGREGGKYSLDFYTEKKSICLNY